MNIKRPPIVVISGATGTGKTKLSIEIAKYYGGEIINADALQIYKGMDIATNKVTEKESQGIVHHLLGFKEIELLDFTVHDFQKLALDKINEIQHRNKMPILVGGTNYYIESILWPTLVNVSNETSTDDTNNDSSIRNKFHTMNNEELYGLLQKLDSKSANILHPNDRRKVLRAVEIAAYSNKTKFDYLSEQLDSRRFNLNEVVFLWIFSEIEFLFPRLDKRVDEMMDMGLLFELFEIQKLFKQICPLEKYTQGIFQAIGFKEFHDYLNFTNEEDAIEKERVLESCIEKLKIANKKYVKAQNKWVINRFLKKNKESVNIPLFKLDSSDVSKWEENVFKQSISVIEQIIKSKDDVSYSNFVKQLSIQPESLRDDVKYIPSQNVCKICDNQLFISEQQWSIHLNSRRHQKRKKKLEKTFANDVSKVKYEV